jgi:hypothetical protein
MMQDERDVPRCSMVLFKILILLNKNISYILNLFSDKSNHNIIYDDFFIFLIR